MGRAGNVKAIALLTWAVLLTPTAGAAAAPLDDVCEAATIAELPVAIEGRRPLVKATVNGVEMSFLADSGAIFSMVSPASAKRVGLTLRPAPAGFVLGGIGGKVDARVATVRRFGVAGLTLADVDFFVGGSEIGTAGLLGQNVLGVADTDYDLAGGMIRLVRGGGCPDRVMRDAVSGRQASAIGLEPQTRSQRHIAGLASLNGIGLRAIFDTGAPTTLLSLEAARRAGIGPGDPGVLPAGTTNGLGGAITQSWLAPGLHYRLGEVEMRGDVLRIADLGAVPFDLVIGADFFLAHRVYVANSRGKLYFMPVRGPAHAPSLPVLADAEAYSQRGAALAASGDLANAIADFSRAIEMAPREPRYRVLRAKARLDNKDGLLARADLDQAIAMKPEEIEARLARAVLLVVEKNHPLARIDLAAVARAAGREDDRRFASGALYAGMEDWRASFEQFDVWIGAHPGDDRQDQALNARCWARAMLNETLRQALDDCDAALRLQPNEAAYFDSRATVLLRLGELDRAIADFDIALAQLPDLAWSRFGRGLAKRRKGLDGEGIADIAVALAVQPDLSQKAVRIGLIRSAADPR